MSDWTPTTQQVRDGYRFDPEAEYHDPITPHHEINGRAFDRWFDALIPAEPTPEMRVAFGKTTGFTSTVVDAGLRAVLAHLRESR